MSIPTYINPENLKHRSDTVIWNGTIHVAGVMPSNPQDDVQAQARNVFAVIDERLRAAGSDKSLLLSATIYLVDVRQDVAAFNAAWNEWVVPGRQPARACVQASLQLEGRLEVSVIAAAKASLPAP